MKPLPTLIQMEVAIAAKIGIRKNIIIPNISWGFHIHEMDIASISPSGYLTEIEIKRSVSDFRADFKKRHKHKSDRIKYFFYAMPDSVYEKVKDEIPVESGVLLIINNPNIYGGSFIASYKKFPKANPKSRKLTDKEILSLTRLGCMRIWNLKSQINQKPQQ